MKPSNQVKSSKQGKDGNEVFAPNPNVVRTIPLSQIDVDWGWNTRTKQVDKNGALVGVTGLENTGTYENVRDSIREEAKKVAGTYMPHNGQRDHVIVRLHPEEKSGKPYKLVAGYLRCEAIAELAKEAKISEPLVRTVVKAYETEEDALLENIAENSGKTQYNDSDMVCGIARLIHNPKLSQDEIARAVNRSQSWVSKAKQICVGVKPDVLLRWRVATGGVGMTDMMKLAKLDKQDQDTAFEQIMVGKSSSKRGQKINDLPSTEGPTRWVGTLAFRALEIGFKLGIAESGGDLTIGDPSTFFTKQLYTFVSDQRLTPGYHPPCKPEELATQKKVHADRIALVVKAFRDGWTRGVEGRPMVDELPKVQNGESHSVIDVPADDATSASDAA